MESIYTIKIEPLTFDYDVKSDGLYRLGYEEGFEIGRQEGIEIGRQKAATSLLKQAFANGLLDCKYSFGKIATIAGLGEDQVAVIALDFLQNQGQSQAEALAIIEQYKLDFPTEKR
jgi:predicted transposase YdaD